MSIILSLQSGSTIYIENIAFAGGGEGDVYRVTQPAAPQKQVVKLYKPNKRNTERAQKIAYLIANPPFPSTAGFLQQNKISIVWATDMVYENKQFAGFVMPAAEGVKLEMLCQTKLPPTLGKEWQRLSFDNSESMHLRLKICYNVVLTILQLHRFNRYALIDLKPDNILVQANGTIALIDTDSLAVFDHEQLRFAAPVVTPDFAPPEYYRGIEPNMAAAAQQWDMFSLCVIFYRLLCGIHPYVGTCSAPFDHIHDISGKVAQGLFVKGKHEANYSIVPPPHQLFEQLPSNIRALFRQCFDKGHSHASLRPTADDWYITLLTHLADLPPNRPLPSKQWQPYNPSTPAKLFLSSTWETPTPIALLNLPTNLSAGNSPQALLAANIIAKERSIKALFDKIASMEQLRRQVFSKFEQQQTEHLRQAQSQIQQAVGTFKQKLAHIDQVAVKLYWQEKKTFEQIEGQLQQQLAQIDKPKQQYIQTHLRPIEILFARKIAPIAQQLQAINQQEMTAIKIVRDNYQKKISAARQRLNVTIQRHYRAIMSAAARKLKKLASKRRSLQKKEAKEVKLYLKEWQKEYVLQNLANYKIADYAHSIFRDAHAHPQEIARLLARHGIVTAADFDTVFPTKGIRMRRTGKIVKLPGMGSVRSMSLFGWQKRIRAALQAQLPSVLAQYTPTTQIARSFKQQYNQILEEEQQINEEAENEKRMAYSQIISKNSKIIQTEQVIKQQLQQKITTLQSQFSDSKKSLERQISELKAQCIKATQNIRSVLTQMEQRVQSSKNKLQQHTDYQKKEIIEQHDAKLNSIIEKEKLFLNEQIKNIENNIERLLLQNAQYYQTQLKQIEDTALPIQEQLPQLKQQLLYYQNKWKQ